MRAIASATAPPRPGPPPAVRSGSNAADRPGFLTPPLPAPRLRLRRRRPPEPSPPSTRRPMPPPSAAAGGAAVGGSFPELTSASDFLAVAAPGGRVSVVGFGSLLSERSARSTFPELEGFRVAALRGFRRVFAHSAPIFFERGIAVEATKEFSSLSVEPCKGELIVVTVFEIKEDEVPAFIEREHEFRFLAVVPEGLDGVPFTNPAVVCARYSDEEYFQERCQDIYHGKIVLTPAAIPRSHLNRGTWEVLIHWKDLPASDTTWVPCVVFQQQFPGF
ncbi:uncharacterized protein LOC133928750 isoform X2 [Phragmites australis]|uniref:uncharacterized protein LOC133928750 isoform X2 n=1 Tax=Phragmites australis TaxID=29695 RepID=UPI002D77C177|nr:uncharacterized protein LOC133928750 isoform X2 [Phragmites australis]